MTSASDRSGEYRPSVRARLIRADRLSGTLEWHAAEGGEEVELVLAPLEIVPPAAEAVSTSGLLRWSLERGIDLVVLDPMSLHLPPISERPGSSLAASDVFSIRGNLPHGIQVISQSLIPSRAKNDSWLPKTERTSGGEVLRFEPSSVEFTQATIPKYPGATRTGILGCPADLPLHLPEKIETSGVFETGAATDHKCAEGKLSGGYEFRLRRRSGRFIDCNVTGPDSPAFLDACRHVASAAGIAAGSVCSWRSYHEECQNRSRVVFTGAQHAPGLRFQPFVWNVPDEDFAEFLRLYSEAASDKTLEEGLSLVSLCWLPQGTVLEVVGLVACSVLEGLLGAFHDRLPTDAKAEPIPEFELKTLKDALAKEPMRGLRVSERVAGFLKNINQVRAADVLYAIHRTLPTLVSERQIQAWKDVRNPLAHGRYDLEDPEMYLKVALVHNVINKVVFALVKYQGLFRDYAHPGWGLAKNILKP